MRFYVKLVLFALLALILPVTSQIFANYDQKPALILYYSPHCIYSRKVLHYLDGIGKTVPMKNVAGNPEASEELLRIGGKKQVPCLTIDGTALYDADAIIDWMKLHPDSLLPKKPISAILTRL